MRLWLKDSERRPDPAPLATDDRAAFLAGTLLWIAGFIVVLVLLPQLESDGQGWWFWTCVSGLAVGVLGLIYTAVKRRTK